MRTAAKNQSQLLTIPVLSERLPAVDPTFNNLAVAGGDGGVPANVAIFTDEQGIPAVYTEGSAAAFNNCTYDGDGNLYTAGETIFELPAGGSSFNSITPEGIQVGRAPAFSGMENTLHFRDKALEEEKALL